MSRSKLLLAVGCTLAGVNIPLTAFLQRYSINSTYGKFGKRREYSNDLNNPAVAKAHAKRLRKNQLRLTNQGAAK